MLRVGFRLPVPRCPCPCGPRRRREHLGTWARAFRPKPEPEVPQATGAASVTATPCRAYPRHGVNQFRLRAVVPIATGRMQLSSAATIAVPDSEIGVRRSGKPPEARVPHATISPIAPGDPRMPAAPASSANAPMASPFVNTPVTGRPDRSKCLSWMPASTSEQPISKKCRNALRLKSKAQPSVNAR